MNKIRIIGLGISVLGIITLFTFGNDVMAFISAFLIGLGLGFLITGKVNNRVDD